MHPFNLLRFGAAALFIAQSTLAADGEPEEVVVTSTALRESPLEVAQPTAVLAGDTLRRQIASSIGETLSKELGLSSTYFGPSASRPVIRGLGGYRVQTLQDGLASLDVASLSQDHAVSVESVVSQQIEVIKGPAALLYGSGASGGLVNVVTNRIPMSTPREPLGGAVELRGDTATNERTGAASLDGGAGLLAFHADYFKRDTDDVEIPGYAQSDALRRQLIEAGEEPDDIRGYIPNTASEAEGGALGASLVGAAARGGVSWSRYETTYGIPGEEEAFIDMKQDRFDGKAEWDLQGALTMLHLSGSYNDYTHTEFEGPGEPGTVFNQTAYETRLAADNDLGNGWRGTTGIQYVDVDFAAIGEEAFVPSSVTRQMSVFAFEERHFDAWTVELGARAEKQTIDVDPAAALPDYDETAVSLSAGAVWNFRTDNALALNVTRTQRNPQSTELYASPEAPHVAAQRFETGDPDLDKEEAVTADLSLRRMGDGIQWTVSAFYNDYSNYIYENPTGVFQPTEEGDEFQVFEYMQGGAKFHGVEAEVLFPLLTSGDRSLQLRLASDYVRGKLDNGDDLPQIPPLRFGAGLHYDQGDWHLGLDTYYYDRQDRIAANELPTDSFTLVDLDTSYRLPIGNSHALLFLRGTNLLDEDARQHASPLKDIAPLPGRALHLGARVEF
ncbi:MAG TPA: TonB-dependent receptor [Povalibacter sp.]|uniref:TonB-dependent receptor n=1 Tax=Povalibacter sp. TaxID=1962978 RepID=UPI002B83968A|nr:TonB-dependent receptor [Povalibacter sp.]HMN45864.1 TonB-dependent receptor [Povalibacter sp.]